MSAEPEGKVEITPAMEKAGAKVLDEPFAEEEIRVCPETMARKVYLAMDGARRAALSNQAQI